MKLASVSGKVTFFDDDGPIYPLLNIQSSLLSPYFSVSNMLRDQVEILDSRSKCIVQYVVSLCPSTEAAVEAAEDEEEDNDQDTESECILEVLASDETTAFFGGLRRDTSYRLEVQGLDHDNQSYYSSGPVTVRTAPGKYLECTVAKSHKTYNLGRY